MTSPADDLRRDERIATKVRTLRLRDAGLTVPRGDCGTLTLAEYRAGLRLEGDDQ